MHLATQVRRPRETWRRHWRQATTESESESERERERESERASERGREGEKSKAATEPKTAKAEGKGGKKRKRKQQREKERKRERKQKRDHESQIQPAGAPFCLPPLHPAPSSSSSPSSSLRVGRCPDVRRKPLNLNNIYTYYIGTRLFLSATSGGVHKPRKQALFFRVLPTAVPSEKGFVLPTYCPRRQFSATCAGAVQLLFHLHAEVCVTKRLSCTFMHSTEELKSAFPHQRTRRVGGSGCVETISR